MRFFYLAFLVSAVWASAHAQSLTDVKSRISGKTFWHEHLSERYYFAEDGALLLQYTAETRGRKAGAVREGKWEIGESGRLCLAFADEGINRCYDVTENLYAPRPWHQYDNVYELKEAGQPSNILWNRWMHGNLIAAPDVYKALADGQTPPVDEAAYIEFIQDKIMRLPMHHVYHAADGRVFLADEEIVKKARRSPSKAAALLEKNSSDGITGVWTVKNGRHCYQWSGGYNETCMTVFSARDLYMPQQGWVQVMDDHFIRLIKPSDIIALQ